MDALRRYIWNPLNPLATLVRDRKVYKHGDAAEMTEQEALLINDAQGEGTGGLQDEEEVAMEAEFLAKKLAKEAKTAAARARAARDRADAAKKN